jgi:predicted enzyme related to lactoylglutathione lyase
MATRIRKPGEFCWFNMLTPAPEAARDFYSKLLGWNYVELPGMGHIVQVDGHDVGGLWDLAGPNTPPGTRAHIGVMFKVESADATSEKVNTLGGKAKPAFDIMDKGRMAVCFDPNGAEFDVWEPRGSHGTDVDSMLHGAPSWVETMTTDAKRATAFYSRLFGWEPEVIKTPSLDYTIFKQVSESVAGMLEITPEMGKMPSSWLTYFTVKDVDRALREATELGGKACMPTTEAAGVGRFCALMSPQGVMFYLIQYIR